MVDGVGVLQTAMAQANVGKIIRRIIEMQGRTGGDSQLWCPHFKDSVSCHAPREHKYVIFQRKPRFSMHIHVKSIHLTYLMKNKNSNTFRHLMPWTHDIIVVRRYILKPRT